MKNIYLSVLLLLLSASAFAWTIGPMNYQGRLLDAAGIPVTGSYTFKIRIYDAASGGTLKFEEQHNGVAVNDGVYAILVSTGSTLSGTWDINLWNTPTLYLEAEVNGQTLTPRHLLAATPFAYQANLALTTNNALALGGKSSGAVLQDICKSGKGKWLSIAQKCLGIGTLFPGPTRVLWSTLSADSDFADLDLTGADISGIDFTGADLSNTLFTETIYSIQGVVGATLTGTRWNAAVSTDVGFVQVPVNFFFNNMMMKNMDLTHWNMSTGTEPNRFSAGELSACPQGQMNNWNCRTYPGGAPNHKYLIGPGVDLSPGSAYVNTSDNSIDSRINLDSEFLSRAHLESTLITQAFLNSSLDGAKMHNCHMISSKLQATMIATGISDMSNCLIQTTIFSPAILNTSFQGAKLEYARFEANVGNASFKGATLVNVVFVGQVNNSDFTDAILDNVFFMGGGSGNNSTGTRLFGGGPMPPP